MVAIRRLAVMTRWLRPARLAAAAAIRFARAHGVLRAASLGCAAVRTLGVRGLVRRAAADAGQREEDRRYQTWRIDHTRTAGDLHRLRAEIEGWRARPRISIITPVFNTPAGWLRRCIESVRAQAYPEWELCLCDDGSTDRGTIAALETFTGDPRIRAVRSPVNGGIVQASNAALALATGEFVAFLDHDDELAPDALAEMARRLIGDPALDVVYSDEDKIDDAGRHREPHLKPDWSPELLRSCMYVSHLTVMRRALVQAAGSFRPGTEGAQDYDLMLRVSRRTNRIAHVPAVLYHWRMASGSAANSQLGKPWAIAAGRRALEDDVAARGLRAEVTSAGAAGHYRVRYAIASTTTVMIVKTGDVPSPRRTADEHLLFVDAAVRPLTRESVNALLELSQQEEVGVVGGILLLSDGTIESAGLVLRADGSPLPIFRGEPTWTRGHLSNILDVRNCAAASGACLMTRRSVFEQVGGIDMGAGSLWDVDYCLRVRAAGFRVAITPHADVRRRTASAPAAPAAADLDRLRARWPGILGRDPYYNPNFDPQAANFSLPRQRAR
jgi:GT2 family glycosyltransferase